MSDKIERIREPVHNLIKFNIDGGLEETAWAIIKNPVFQRLRRIKQLGFSELVFPGATHTRFLHSIGVFHTARELMNIAEKAVKYSPDSAKKQAALIAALVHDIGHGPFSHAFENVMQELQEQKIDLGFTDHEQTTIKLIRESELTKILATNMGKNFSDDVVDIFKNKQTSFYNEVVSSQFDADRLDYMRRDRFMTGSQHSAIDFTWLIENLEIDNVAIEDEDSYQYSAPKFVIGYKAIEALEAYILGLFQLYPTIYFHKTTRCAEKFLTKILVRFVQLVKNDSLAKTNLGQNHQLVNFVTKAEINNFLALDDTVIWSALELFKQASDPLLSCFSQRLLERKLYKCIDIRKTVIGKINAKPLAQQEVSTKIDSCCVAILSKLEEHEKNSTKDIPELMTDAARRDAYKTVESKGTPIYIRDEGNKYVDIMQYSDMVKSLTDYKLTRVYYDDINTEKTINAIIEKECNSCL